MSDSDWYQRVLSEARRLCNDGVAFGEALRALRVLSPSIIDSIKAGRDAYGISLSEAKLLVHSSDAWSDCRQSFDELHETVETLGDEL